MAPRRGHEGWTPHFLLGKRTQSTPCQAHAHTMYTHTHVLLDRQHWAARLSSVYSDGRPSVPVCVLISFSDMDTLVTSSHLGRPLNSSVPSKSHWG